jgi:phage-related baseplate assembly protein
VTVTNPEYLSSGTWILVNGADQESDDSLRARCRDRWATLGAGATEPAIRFLCRAASAEVQKVKVKDAPGTGALDVVIAGASAPVSTGALNDTQTYLDSITRRPTCTQITVRNAAVLSVALVYTVFVEAAYRTSAQQQISAKLSQLQASLPIGPTIYVSQIVRLLTSVTGVDHVGIPPNATDIALDDQIVSFNSQLTFVTV